MYAVSFIKTIRMWCKNKVKTVSNGLYPLTYICYAGVEKIIKLMQKVDKRLSRVLAHTLTWQIIITQTEIVTKTLQLYGRWTRHEKLITFKQSFIIITNLKKLKCHYNDQSRCKIDNTNHIISRRYFCCCCCCYYCLRVMKSKIDFNVTVMNWLHLKLCVEIKWAKIPSGKKTCEKKMFELETKSYLLLVEINIRRTKFMGQRQNIWLKSHYSLSI